jgi:aspartate kinase
MKRIVIKFGGTSVGSAVKIINAAKIAKKRHKEGNQVIVVVSAMSGVTNDLFNKSNKISKDFDKPELDVLLSSGEQISSSLLAGALINLGMKSRSWLGWQVPIRTEGDHASSRIFKIQTSEVTSFLKEGGIPVIAGFQGISKRNRISTIGRGGSDTSALMVAKFFNTDSCEIYTDVKGVYTTDPSMSSKAKKINKISYEEMLEMSSLGAKVMQPSAVQTAMSNNISVHVRSTFSKETGTQIVHEDEINNKKVVTGVTYSKNDAKITLLDVKDKPGVAADIFEPLDKSNINVDMVVQNISSDKNKTDITFTIKREDLRKTIKIIKKNRENVDYKKLIHDDKVSKVSIIGAGMIVHPGVTYKMFRSLADEKVNILVISTSEIKISVLIDEKMTQKAVKALHKTFKLD